MAHCSLDVTWVARSRPGRTNHTLSTALYDNLAAVGAPTYDSAAIAVAQDIQRNLGMDPMDEPFLDECEQLHLTGSETTVLPVWSFARP